MIILIITIVIAFHIIDWGKHCLPGNRANGPLQRWLRSTKGVIVLARHRQGSSRTRRKLQQLHCVRRNLHHTGVVTVDIAKIRGREDGQDGGNLGDGVNTTEDVTWEVDGLLVMIGLGVAIVLWTLNVVLHAYNHGG